MKKISKRHASRAFAALLALSGLSGIAQATNLLKTTTTPAAISLTCDTKTGPGTAGVIVLKTVTALTGTQTLAVGISGLATGISVSPTTGTFTGPSGTNVTSLTFTVNISAAGCNGLTPQAATATLFTFTQGSSSTADVPVLGAIVAATTANGTGLTTSVTSVALTCAKAASVYTPGPAQSVSVSSVNPLGTPYYVDVTTAVPNWLTISPEPLTGAPATATTPAAVRFVAAAGCGTTPALGSVQSYTVTLDTVGNTGSTFVKTIAVTLTIVAPAPVFTVSPAAPSLTFTKGSGTLGTVSLTVSSSISPAPYFSVDPATVPSWLAANPPGGVAKTIAAGPAVIVLTTTSACNNLAPGNYSASIGLLVSGDAEYFVPVKLQINNSNPTLSVVEGTTRNLTWAYGSATPSLFVTAQSTDSPIPYTITTGGPLAPSVPSTELTGLAYSFGTPIPVTFSQLVFASAAPGSVLTGTVSLTWGNPAVTTVVTINYTVVAPAAAVSSVSPGTIPTCASTCPPITVNLTGSGFVVGSTKVGIVTGTTVLTMTQDPNIQPTVTSSSNMYLTITVPSVADPNLPFSPTGTGGPVVLGVCNPSGSTCVPTSSFTLTIANGPQIQAVSSASTFAQVSGSTPQTFAPYDMLSIFGTGFCTSNGTGCSSSTVLSGTLNAGSLQYSAQVTPDIVTGSNAAANPRYLTVLFQDHTHPATSPSPSYAPILFATNNQINVVAPGWVGSSTQVDIIVGFGYGSTSATLLSSALYTANVASTDPGIYTVGADGTGGIAAINNATYAVINGGNPAGVRVGAATSDIVQIYATGLGVPSTISLDTSSPAQAYPTDCLSPLTGAGNYLTALNNSQNPVGTLTSLDGVIVQGGLLGNNTYLPPCLSTPPTVKIGGVAATVKYAGWVADSVAGLYQLDVLLPPSTSSFVNAAGTSVTVGTPVALPVLIAMGASGTAPFSQTGTYMWVSKQLLVGAPSNLSGTVGLPFSSTITATTASGTAPFSFAVTSGLLPAGLTLTSLSNVATIAGTPVAYTGGSYAVTITATDSSTPPITGSTTFVLNIGGGLYLTSSNGPAFVTIAGSSVPNLTILSASGGAYPYTYAITAPGVIPTDMTVGASSGQLGYTSLTPVGTYAVTVQATDANGLTGVYPLSLDLSFTLTPTISSPVTHGTGQTVATIASSGASGTPTFSLIGTVPTGFTVTSASGTGTVAIAGSVTAGTYSVTVKATDSTAPADGTAATATTTLTITVL